MDVYDEVEASTLEAGDQIVVDGDNLIEVRSVDDDIDVITVNGYSNDTGDLVTVTLDPDDLVPLWGV